MPRGGYRRPDRPAGVSGPGRFSKRTDGQPKAAPDLDTPGQQYGDRKTIEDAQTIAPIRGAQGGGDSRRLQGHARSTGSLPSFIFDRESSSPLEPATAGLDIGAGPGSEVLDAATPPEDEREVVLMYLQDTFQNAEAAQMLADLRNQRAASAPVRVPPSGPTLQSTPVVE